VLGLLFDATPSPSRKVYTDCDTTFQDLHGYATDVA